jgi:D-alanyl-D-alanine carboxypeptidase/D-alanyl-D-alanine-endopeptidase (penicillin-binding protein 4)
MRSTLRHSTVATALQRARGIAAAALSASAVAIALLPSSACAQSGRADPEPGFDSLPTAVARELRSEAIAPSSVAIVVRAIDSGALDLQHNASAPMNPASTMKLLTTYAALELLGPAFQWRTEALASAPLRNGRLEGDLFLRGSGDPSLVIERFWIMARRLRGVGLRQISGDLVLDKSAFDSLVGHDASLDGNQFRPYNVEPDALLVNFKTVSFEFIPDPAAALAHVIATPALAGMRLPRNVPLVAGTCGDWHEKLRADFTNPWAPAFAGRFPQECGTQSWHVSLLDHTTFVGAAFRPLWESAGGAWSGHARDGRTPAGARLLLVQESPPLSEIVRDINKYSNNVMARQLFLALGTGGVGPDASAARSSQAVSNWLQREGLPMPELVLENGCGLSRRERISAGSLARLLQRAFASPRMPEFVASLPIAGLDGTMKHRAAAAGSAYVKTGLLDGVRAVAGYVLAASGHRYVVVAIVNQAEAERSTGALDALLEWVQQQG